MGRTRKPSATPGDIRKAQKRQFKAICSRIDKHVQEFKTPVIMMGVINGTLCFTGSEKLKKFCEDVQEKFLNIASSSAKLFKTQESTIKKGRKDQEPDVEIINLENSTYRFLRCFVANAVQRSGRSYAKLVRPLWWPENVPFISPNHPPEGTAGLRRNELMAVAESYQTYSGMDKSEGSGLADSSSSLITNENAAITHLSEATDRSDLTSRPKSIPDKFIRMYLSEQSYRLDCPQLRRSCRKVKKQSSTHPPDIEKSLERQSDEGLQVTVLAGKGRGVVATKNFLKHSFVCEYSGDLITLSEARDRERQYEKSNVGCFVFKFKHNSKSLCIDATKEDGTFGRLINHSITQANVVPRVIELQRKPRLYFAAKRDITTGEELLYDYGERDPSIVSANLWLKT